MKKTKNKTLKNQLIVITCLIIIASALIEAHYFATINDVGFAEAQVVEKVKEKNLSIQEYVFQEVEKALGMKEAIKAVSIVQCESGWNPEATNVNKDKTIDRGLWQINNHFQKQVSGACAYDYKCATKEAIKIYQKRGNWSAWVCGK